MDLVHQLLFFQIDNEDGCHGRSTFYQGSRNNLTRCQKPPQQQPIKLHPSPSPGNNPSPWPTKLSQSLPESSFSTVERRIAIPPVLIKQPTLYKPRHHPALWTVRNFQYPQSIFFSFHWLATSIILYSNPQPCVISYLGQIIEPRLPHFALGSGRRRQFPRTTAVVAL